MVRVITSEAVGGSFAIYDADVAEWYGQPEQELEPTKEDIVVQVIEVEIELL